MRELNQFLKFIEQRPGEAFVLATLVQTEGSTYRKAGAQKLIAMNGDSIGLISGGCLEKEIINQALQFENQKHSHVFNTQDSNDRLFGYGLGCQGKLKIQFEKMSWSDLRNRFENTSEVQKLWLHVVGAGADIDPLKELVDVMGWNLHFYSTQRDMVEARKNQGWDITKVKNDDISWRPTPQDRTAVLLMSHNYSVDLVALVSLIKQPPAYLGVLGPSSRKEMLLKDAQEIYKQKISADFCERIFGPIGIDGLGRGESSIALSTVTQLQQIFFGINR